MYRRLLTVASRVGHPSPTLTVGHSNGRRCYLTATTAPLAIAVPLDVDQVDEVIAALTAWRDQVDADRRPFGRPCSPAQSPEQAAV